MTKAKSIQYKTYLLESLKDSQEAAGYLNAALEGGDIATFLLALQNVIQAQGGMAKIANKVDKSRTSLYKALSKTGNPYLKSTSDLLAALNLKLAVIYNKNANKKTRKHTII